MKRVYTHRQLALIRAEQKAFVRSRLLCGILCLAAVVHGAVLAYDMFRLTPESIYTREAIILLSVRTAIHILIAGLLAIPVFFRVSMKQMSFVPVLTGLSELLFSAAFYAEYNDTDGEGLGTLIVGSAILFLILPITLGTFGLSFGGHMMPSKSAAFLPLIVFYAGEMFIANLDHVFIFFIQEVISGVLLLAAYYFSLGCTDIPRR